MRTTTHTNFIAQLGNAHNVGFEPLDTRLHRIPQDSNPYQTGHALPSNAPLFFGREDIQHSLCARLLSPDKPQSVSLVGERRIGKSSLLHQVHSVLLQTPGLMVVYAGFMREWRMAAPDADLFERLQSLSEQGVLRNIGPTYRFSVPLFRLWLVWRWSPDKIRL